MYEFLDRLISITSPDSRLRSVSPASFDGQGNYGLGLPNSWSFQIDYDKIDKVRA